MEAIYAALIKVAATLLALLIAYLGAQLVKWVKAKTKLTDNEYLTAFVDELCEAAEQMFGSGTGAEKLTYVEDLLEKAGVILTDFIKAKIEAKVLKINQAKTATTTTETETSTDVSNSK